MNNDALMSLTDDAVYYVSFFFAFFWNYAVSVQCENFLAIEDVNSTNKTISLAVTLCVQVRVSEYLLFWFWQNYFDENKIVKIIWIYEGSKINCFFRRIFSIGMMLLWRTFRSISWKIPMRNVSTPTSWSISTIKEGVQQNTKLSKYIYFVLIFVSKLRRFQFYCCIFKSLVAVFCVKLCYD